MSGSPVFFFLNGSDSVYSLDEAIGLASTDPTLARELYRLTRAGTESLEDYAYRSKLNLTTKGQNLNASVELVLSGRIGIDEALRRYGSLCDRIRLLRKTQQLLIAQLFACTSMTERQRLIRLQVLMEDELLNARVGKENEFDFATESAKPSAK